MDGLKFTLAIVGIYSVALILIYAMLYQAQDYPVMWLGIIFILIAVGYFTWLLRLGSR